MEDREKIAISFRHAMCYSERGQMFATVLLSLTGMFTVNYYAALCKSAVQHGE